MTLRHGEKVSLGPIHGVTIRGEVVVENLTRGCRLMVRIENGPRQGQLDYPDAPPWKLGAGPIEERCVECDRLYRREVDGDRLFCPGCLYDQAREDQAQAADPSRRASSLEREHRARQARSVK